MIDVVFQRLSKPFGVGATLLPPTRGALPSFASLGFVASGFALVGRRIAWPKSIFASRKATFGRFARVSAHRHCLTTAVDGSRSSGANHGGRRAVAWPRGWLPVWYFTQGHLAHNKAAAGK